MHLLLTHVNAESLKLPCTHMHTCVYVRGTTDWCQWSDPNNYIIDTTKDRFIRFIEVKISGLICSSMLL